MKDLVYISRNFTELGAFSPAEIVDFQKRGILRESDFIRANGSETWQPLGEWLTSAVTEAPPAKAVRPKAPAKKRTAKAGKKEKAAA